MADAEVILTDLATVLIAVQWATETWRRCTEVQRRILSEVCPPVVARLLECGELTADELPMLPDGTRSSTVGSMAAAGLVTWTGRLTAQAVRTWYYAGGGDR